MTMTNAAEPHANGMMPEGWKGKNTAPAKAKTMKAKTKPKPAKAKAAAAASPKAATPKKASRTAAKKSSSVSAATPRRKVESKKAGPLKTRAKAPLPIKDELIKEAMRIGEAKGREAGYGLVVMCQSWAKQLKQTKRTTASDQRYLDLFVKMIGWLESQEASSRQLESIQADGRKLVNGMASESL